MSVSGLFYTNVPQQCRALILTYHFLHMSTQNPENLESQIAVGSYHPTSLMGMSPSKFSRDSSTLVSNQSSTYWSFRNRQAFDMGGRLQARLPCWHRTLRIAFQLRRLELSLLSHSSLWHCVASQVHLQAAAIITWHQCSLYGAQLCSTTWQFAQCYLILAHFQHSKFNAVYIYRIVLLMLGTLHSLCLHGCTVACASCATKQV